MSVIAEHRHLAVVQLGDKIGLTLGGEWRWLDVDEWQWLVHCAAPAALQVLLAGSGPEHGSGRLAERYLTSLTAAEPPITHPGPSRHFPPSEIPGGQLRLDAPPPQRRPAVGDFRDDVDADLYPEPRRPPRGELGEDFDPDPRDERPDLERPDLEPHDRSDP